MSAFPTWTAGLCLLAVLAGSCRKPTSILPPEGNLQAVRTDTLVVRAWTVRDGNTPTTDLLENMLGSEDDPVFGKTEAGIYTQFVLPLNNLNLRPEPTSSYAFDSAVLAMRLTGFYGDETTPVPVRLHPMTEHPEPDSIYESDDDFGIDPVPVQAAGAGPFLPRTGDSVHVLDLTLPPQLRIPLDETWARTTLYEADTTFFDNDSTFRDLLPGLYIAPDTDAGGYAAGFMRLNMKSQFTGIELFYTETKYFGTDSAEDESLRVVFPVSTRSVTAGHYDHDFSGAEVDDYLDVEPDTLRDSILFLKGLGGLKARIEIPDLEDLGIVALNRVTLTFPLTHGTADEQEFPAPGRCYFIRSDSAGNNRFDLFGEQSINYELEQFISVVDMVEGDAHYDGFRQKLDTRLPGPKGQPPNTSPRPIDTEGYAFNLTREFQGILNGTVDNQGFLLLPFPYFRIPHRAVVGSRSHPDGGKRMHIEIVYTVIE